MMRRYLLALAYGLSLVGFLFVAAEAYLPATHGGLGAPAAAGGSCCTIVGTALHTEGTGSSVASLSTASTMNVAAGNLVVVVCRFNNLSGTTPTVTDTGSTNTFVQAVTINSDMVLFYAKNTTAKNPDTFTCTHDTGPDFSFGAITAIQYSGASTSAPLDQTATGTGSGTTATSGSFTTTAANEVLVAAADQSAGFATFSAGTGYTLEPSSGQQIEASEDKVVTATQTGVTASMSWTGVGSSTWNMVVATFK